MCLWAIYIFPGSVHIFSCSRIGRPMWEYTNRSQTHECGNWDWGSAIPFLDLLCLRSVSLRPFHSSSFPPNVSSLSVPPRHFLLVFYSSSFHPRPFLLALSSAFFSPRPFPKHPFLRFFSPCPFLLVPPTCPFLLIIYLSFFPFILFFSSFSHHPLLLVIFSSSSLLVLSFLSFPSRPFLLVLSFSSFLARSETDKNKFDELINNFET
jgi:hypothetical protein